MYLGYPIWIYFGCQNNVSEEYAARKAFIEQSAPPLAENWQPDILLRLKYQRLSDIGKTVMEEHLKTLPDYTKTVLGITTSISPKLRIERLSLMDAPRADEVQIQAVLKGPWKWIVGPVDGKEPSTIKLKGTVKIETVEGEVHLRIMDVDQVNIQIADIKLSALKSIDLGNTLEDWIREQILKTPSIPLGTIDLPVRGFRFNSTPQSQNIELRSDIAHTNNITETPLQLEHDWELWVHQDTLLGWAQEKAFETGVVGYGVAIDPISLSVEDQEFDLGLRLWKIEGRGHWWRDYTANGRILSKKQNLKFKSSSVEEIGKSHRAGLVDPLALLAEGTIENVIGEQLQHSLPMQQSKKMDQFKWTLNLQEWNGIGNQIRLQGEIDIKTPKKPKKK